MISPPLGSLTRRSPSGVHASIRAPGTRAQTRAVQPTGTVRVCAAPPSPAGTTRGVADRADAAGDPDEAGAGDDGVAVPCPWPAESEPGDPEHAAAAAMTAAARSATMKLRPGTVRGFTSPSSGPDPGACRAGGRHRGDTGPSYCARPSQPEQDDTPPRPRRARATRGRAAAR